MDNISNAGSSKNLRLTGVLLIACFMVTACAQMGGGFGPQSYYRPGMTPDEQRLQQQSEAFNQTIWEGCLVGAVGGGALGCGIGAMTGECNFKDILIGAAAGAIAGCTAGAYLANLQKSHKTNEQQVTALTNDVRGDNQQLTAYIGTAKRVIAADKAKLSQITRGLAAGRLSREQANLDLASVDANQGTLKKTLENAKQRHAQLMQVNQQVASSDPRQKAAAAQEIKRMEQQIAVLDSDLNSLIDARRLVSVG